MARPRVVSETKRKAIRRSPPADARPHEWMSTESLDLYRGAAGNECPFDVYVSALAERKIRDQAARAAPSSLEVMGLLLGEVCEWQQSAFVMVRDACTTDLNNTPSKVRFDPDALPKLFVELDGAGFDYVVVGWYHSHPGHTCFLSRTDLDTQRALFDQSYHCALVIDPVNRELKMFKLAEAGYTEVPFAIFTDSKPRVRRLKDRG
jgi:26S proteasome regulatory subunit N11